MMNAYCLSLVVPGSGKSLLIRELSEQKGWKYLEAKQLIEEEFC